MELLFGCLRLLRAGSPIPIPVPCPLSLKLGHNFMVGPGEVGLKHVDFHLIKTAKRKGPHQPLTGAVLEGDLQCFGLESNNKKCVRVILLYAHLSPKN